MNQAAGNVDVHVNCPCSQSCAEHESSVHILANNHVRFVFNKKANPLHVAHQRQSSDERSKSASLSSHSSDCSLSTSLNPPTKRRKPTGNDYGIYTQSADIAPSSCTPSSASSTDLTLDDDLFSTCSSVGEGSHLAPFSDPSWTSVPAFANTLGNTCTTDLSTGSTASTPLDVHGDMFGPNAGVPSERLYKFDQSMPMAIDDPTIPQSLSRCDSQLSLPPSKPTDDPVSSFYPESTSAVPSALPDNKSLVNARLTSIEPSPTPLQLPTASPPAGTGEAQLMRKRINRLERLLRTLQTAPMPTVSVHNEAIAKLFELQRAGAWDTSSNFQKSGNHGSTETPLSAHVKFIADVFTWESFRQDETQLIEQRGYTAISASKEVNACMMSTCGRTMKTRDWASDGRKAARMTFDALKNEAPAAQLFMLMLLATNVSSDHMLKIAHFPTIRQRFEGSLRHIVQQRVGDWSTLAALGYHVIDPRQLL